MGDEDCSVFLPNLKDSEYQFKNGQINSYYKVCEGVFGKILVIENKIDDKYIDDYNKRFSYD